MIDQDDVYKIGTIVKPHALHGEVVLNFTDDIFMQDDVEYLIIDTDGILVPFFIDSVRLRSGQSALIKFDDIDDIDKTRLIVGSDVYIEKSIVRQYEQDELPLSYFVGFEAVLADGTSLGRIADTDDQTENWLFIVLRADGKELLIPAHEQFITNIDHKARIVEMQLPEGLLEL